MSSDRGALAGVVLCGGQSSRMGAPKAWLDVGGEVLLARTVRVVGEVAARVVVVAAVGQALPALPTSVRVVRDAVEGRGPLQGLAAGLDAIATDHDLALVCATDAPFLHAAFVRRLVALLRDEDLAVVPEVGARVHALAALYRTSARDEIARGLAAGDLRLGSLLARLHARRVGEAELLAGAELARADGALRSLVNVNTREEYEAAIAAIGLSSRA
jgi:molybdopterin-guanine dinucleotide biosynthesis protein A